MRSRGRSRFIWFAFPLLSLCFPRPPKQLIRKRLEKRDHHLKYHLLLLQLDHSRKINSTKGWPFPNGKAKENATLANFALHAKFLVCVSFARFFFSIPRLLSPFSRWINHPRFFYFSFWLCFSPLPAVIKQLTLNVAKWKLSAGEGAAEAESTLSISDFPADWKDSQTDCQLILSRLSGGFPNLAQVRERQRQAECKCKWSELFTFLARLSLVKCLLSMEGHKLLSYGLFG